MTSQMTQLFIIMALAMVLLISEKLCMDIVALFVLGVLTFIGLVTPTEALPGFSSPAVVTA